jgi:hypothetical protein
MSTTNRPLGVALLSFVLMIGGALDIVGGLLLFTERNDDALARRIGTSEEIAALALGGVLLGIIVIAVAAALRNGSNFARWLITFIATVRGIAFLYAVVQFAKGDWYDALVPAVVYCSIAAYLLFDKDSQAFFARSA